MSKNNKSSEEILKMSEELMEALPNKECDKDQMPNIAELSEEIENLKYLLAIEFSELNSDESRGMYLALININLVVVLRQLLDDCNKKRR